MNDNNKILSPIKIIMPLLLIAIILGAVCSCDKTEEETAQRDEVAAVTRFPDIGFSVELPPQWKRLNEKKIEEAKKLVENKEQISIFKAAIEASYEGSHDDSIIISTLTSEQREEQDAERHLQTYITDIEQYYSKEFTVNTEESKVDSFDAVFLQVYNDQLFIVKTVYSDGNDTIFQIDFIIPRDNLTEELLKEIENVLLSVKKI